MKDILEVDIQYPEKSNDFRNDLPFLPEKMKVKKCEKLVTNLHDKTEYVYIFSTNIFT